MYIFEPSNRIEVRTPKGDGVVWLVTEYGSETDTMYTIIINNTGEMWQYTHKDLIVKNNITFGRNVLNKKDGSYWQYKNA